MLMLRWTLDANGRLTATVVRLPTKTRPLALLGTPPQAPSAVRSAQTVTTARAASARADREPEPEVHRGGSGRLQPSEALL
ncbi:MAG: hypothetical protein N2378_01990 [Chloroflexaceae bacterium]|nr:hypothetical protein [Chloroflexaceae bacterium]